MRTRKMSNAPRALGTVNGAFGCTLWKGQTVVGRCIDTPNSVAYGMRATGADRSTSWLGENTRATIGEDRIAAGGWFTSDEDAMFAKG